jgi:TIR domain
VKIECDEIYEWLRINGEEFKPSGDAEGEFEVLASHLGQTRLADLPKGVSIRLCDRVIGSSELVQRQPYCAFEHTRDGVLRAHGETAFIGQDNFTPAAMQQFLTDSILAATRSLAPLVANKTVTTLKESIYQEIGYLSYSVVLKNQRVLDAEMLVADLESRMHEGLDRPTLFICHASEDKPFVDRLVHALDSQALHVWYDKREILVGDSIVGRVNQALETVRFVLAVLSPCSVTKPWVVRELNSSLMRQIDRKQVIVLPALIANCDLPPLIADLKYADFRMSFDRGLEELLAGMRQFRA